MEYLDVKMFRGKVSCEVSRLFLALVIFTKYHSRLSLRNETNRGVRVGQNSRTKRIAPRPKARAILKLTIH